MSPSPRDTADRFRNTRDRMWQELVNSFPDRSQLAGTPGPAAPAHMRLYPESSKLKWEAAELIVRQRELETGSAQVRILFDRLDLVLKTAARHNPHFEGIEVEDLTFTLDASAPVADNTRAYLFDIKTPVRGKVKLVEAVAYGRYAWRYYLEAGGATREYREMTHHVAETPHRTRLTEVGGGPASFERALDL